MRNLVGGMVEDGEEAAQNVRPCIMGGSATSWVAIVTRSARRPELKRAVGRPCRTGTTDRPVSG